VKKAILQRLGSVVEEGEDKLVEEVQSRRYGGGRVGGCDWAKVGWVGADRGMLRVVLGVGQ